MTPSSRPPQVHTLQGRTSGLLRHVTPSSRTQIPNPLSSVEKPALILLWQLVLPSVCPGHHLAPLHLPLHPPHKASWSRGHRASSLARHPCLNAHHLSAILLSSGFKPDDPGVSQSPAGPGSGHTTFSHLHNLLRVCPAGPSRGAELLRKRNVSVLCLQSKTLCFIIFKHYQTT